MSWLTAQRFLCRTDVTNEARALLLLQDQGLLTLKEDAGLTATINDITENPKNLDIVELEAAQLPRSLQDADIAVINGNYAIEAGLKVTDALAVESSDSLAAQTYGNVVAVREGDEESDKTKALMEVLTSDDIKEFIETKYDGSGCSAVLIDGRNLITAAKWGRGGCFAVKTAGGGLFFLFMGMCVR